MAVVDTSTSVVAAPGTAAVARTWKQFVPALVVGLSFAPVLVLHARALWERPHYQFFPLVIPGAALLAWRSCRWLGDVEPGDTRISTALAVLGWGMLAVSVLFVSSTAGAIASLFTLAVALFTLGGKRLLLPALPAWGLLWLTIPPPRQLDYLLISKLQNVVSRWSSELLDIFGVFHRMDGNVVEVAGRRLLVDQACSGVYSLLTLLIGTLFYVLWVKTSPTRAIALILASVFWVLFGNVARIVVVVLLSTNFGIDAASGWKHETLGLVMFALMLGLVLSTDRLLAFAMSVLGLARNLIPKRFRRHGGKTENRRLTLVTANTYRQGPSGRAGAKTEPAIRPVETDTNSAAPVDQPAAELPAALPEPVLRDRTVLTGVGRTWLASPFAAVAFGALFIPQLMMPGVTWKNVLLATDVYNTLFAPLDEKAMPEQLGYFKRAGFRSEKRERDNSWGEYSRAWVYNGPGRAAGVSLDYQFVDWHDLTLCYRSQGWTLFSRQSKTDVDGTGGGPVVVALFNNLEGRHGYLIYGMYDRRTRPIDAPATRGVLKELTERLESWMGTGKSGGRDADRLCYQFQVFQEGDAPPTPAEETAIHQLFGQARAKVEQVVKGDKGVSR
jgi:exosortase